MKTLILTLLFPIFVSPILAQGQFKLLLLTHADPWHSETIPVAIEAFREMSVLHHFQYEWTVKPTDLVEKLPECDVVVFVNANSEMLDSLQMEALKTFMARGGGFVGIHRASASAVRNAWFDGLVGGVFTKHPKLQTGIINVVDKDFPGNLHLGDKWLWSDEWYNFSNIDLDKINVVLEVDESSYDYTMGYSDEPMKGMGKNHPIAWTQEYGGGRMFYTSLGHKPEAFKNPVFLNHIFGGIYWVVHDKVQ